MINFKKIFFNILSAPKMNRHPKWLIGTLPKPLTAKGGDWSIEPLPNHTEIIEQWKERAIEDWIYPPLIESQNRPLKIWFPPTTHRLTYNGKNRFNPENEKTGIAGFIMHVIGFFHGVELQFEGWGVTGKQHSSCQPTFHLHNDGKALSSALEILPGWYTKQRQETQKTISNALYMHNHIPSFEWWWEKFAWQYSVFDTCWKLATTINSNLSKPQKSTPHKKRFEELARSYNLKIDTGTFSEWVRLRNDLIHEVSWSGNQPGWPPRGSDAEPAYKLRIFTSFALLAIMTYNSPSIFSTNWNTRGRIHLEAAP